MICEQCVSQFVRARQRYGLLLIILVISCFAFAISSYISELWWFALLFATLGLILARKIDQLLFNLLVNALDEKCALWHRTLAREDVFGEAESLLEKCKHQLQTDEAEGK